MIKTIFQCDECFTESPGDELTREVRSITERSSGLGTYRYTTAREVAPDGWVAFDPYTGCTYCPKCWAEIEDEMES